MARLLRIERQLSVDELAKRLALPRSTIYYWVRDLPLCSSARGAPNRRRLADGIDAPPAAGELGRESVYEEALRSYDDLIVQPTFRDFLCIYVTEGYKRDRSKVALAGGDAAVMRLVHRWVLRLTDKSPVLSVEHDREQGSSELRRFWSETVGEQASEIQVRRARRSDPLHDWSARPLHGVLTVSVDDALLRARLQAWMRRTREAWR